LHGVMTPFSSYVLEMGLGAFCFEGGRHWCGNTNFR